MGYFERVIEFAGVDSAMYSGSAYNNNHCYYYYNGSQLSNRPSKSYTFLISLKKITEAINDILNQIPVFEHSLEVVVDTVNEITGFGDYHAYINFTNKNYKIEFYSHNEEYSYYVPAKSNNHVYAYCWIKMHDINSSVTRQLNLPISIGVSSASNIYNYVVIKIYCNNDNLAICFFDSQTESPQVQSGNLIYCGQLSETLDESNKQACFSTDTLSIGTPASMTSFSSKHRNSDTVDIYNVITNLLPEEEDYKSKAMKAYVNDMTWYLENAYILSNDIKGLIKDADNHKYICFGKFMFQYE